MSTRTAFLVSLVFAMGCARAAPAPPQSAVNVVLPDGSWTMSVARDEASNVVIAATPTSPTTDTTGGPSASTGTSGSSGTPGSPTASAAQVTPTACQCAAPAAPAYGLTGGTVQLPQRVKPAQVDWINGAYVYP